MSKTARRRLMKNKARAWDRLEDWSYWRMHVLEGSTGAAGFEYEFCAALQEKMYEVLQELENPDEVKQ